MMYRDGWYYLLGTHGTCCDGTNSTYNIRVGRSKKVTGPYLDNMGRDMIVYWPHLDNEEEQVSAIDPDDFDVEDDESDEEDE